MFDDRDALTFLDSQISRGLKPLAEHGAVVVSRERTIRLFDAHGQLIDQAQLTEVTAKAVRLQPDTLIVQLQGRQYAVAPGWGNSRWGSLGAMIAPQELALMLLDVVRAGDYVQILRARGIPA